MSTKNVDVPWLSIFCLLVIAFIVGGFIGARIAESNLDSVPFVLDLESEDELCIDIIFNKFTQELHADVWRGDPDTCAPIGDLK